MSKLRKLLIAMLIAVMAVCVSVAVAACGGDDNPFRDNGSNGGNPVEGDFTGDYKIIVMSAGGLPLSDVQVKLSGNGEDRTLISDENGQIAITLTPNVYDLTVDENSLPLGYYVPEGAAFRTTADEAEVIVALPSRIIPYTAASSKRYSLGEVIHTFGFTEGTYDADGVYSEKEYTLEELLDGKKAVVINFWYIDCDPCRREFPAIEAAYKAFQDSVSVVALSQRDTKSSIATFKQQNGYTFHMAYDTAGLHSMFNVAVAPTTIIIDRYGVIVYHDTGSMPSEAWWKGVLMKYTSDDYMQIAPDSSTGDDSSDLEWAIPDSGLSMPESAEIISEICAEDLANGTNVGGSVSNFHAETNEADAEAAWPWILAEDESGASYLKATNIGKDYSYATVYFDVTLLAGYALSLEYNIATETDADILFVYMNGSPIRQYSGLSDGWIKDTLYAANRTTTFTIAALYYKDSAKSADNELAAIRNIEIFDFTASSEAFDQAYAVIDEGVTLNNGSYDDADFSVELNPEDGFYYIVYTDEQGVTHRALLLADILNATTWSDLHVGSSTFWTPEDSSYSASLYQLSFWLMSNYEESSGEDTSDVFSTSDEAFTLIFDYDTTEDHSISDAVILNYYLQLFSENGYVPVTEKVKNFIISFTQYYHEFAQKEVYGLDLSDSAKEILRQDYYEDQWLEFCYFFRHYGNPETNIECNETMNPVKGLAADYAIPVAEGVTAVDITSAMNHNGGGLWYSFTPSKTGVYYLKSSTDQEGCDPRVAIYTADGTRIAENNDYSGHDSVIYANAKDYNFYLYVTLEANETYIIQALMATPGSVGAYEMNIEYIGDAYVFLHSFTPEGNIWTWKEDAAGNILYHYLITQASVAFNPDDGFYHVLKKETDGSFDFGTVAYINFVDYSYFYASDNTLYEAILNNQFDLTEYNGEDYTDELLDYYEKSIEGKDEDDLLYGKIEADERLVYILNQKIFSTDSDAQEQSYGWLLFGCYCEYLGTAAN